MAIIIPNWQRIRLKLCKDLISAVTFNSFACTACCNGNSHLSCLCQLYLSIHCHLLMEITKCDLGKSVFHSYHSPSHLKSRLTPTPNQNHIHMQKTNTKLYSGLLFDQLNGSTWILSFVTIASNTPSAINPHRRK